MSLMRTMKTNLENETWKGRNIDKASQRALKEKPT